MDTKELLKAMSDMMDEKLDTKFDENRKEIVKLTEKVEMLSENQQALTEKVEMLSEGQQALFEGQQALFEGQQALFEGQQALSEKVEMTYQLALDAWGTGKENRNWLQKVF